MIALALDTSTRATAIGLHLDDGALLAAHDRPGRRARPGHQARLLPLAADVLGRAGVSWRDIERIGVGTGPGTYTGLRVGVATARSLARALDAELVGVPSPLALAYGALERDALVVAPSGDDGAAAGRSAAVRAAAAGAAAAVAVTITDARRGELFVAAYARGGSQGRGGRRAAGSRDDGWPLEALALPRPVRADALADAVAELVREVPRRPDQRASRAAPSAGASWIAVGDGVEDHARALASFGIAAVPAGADAHEIDGRALCALAVQSAAREPRAVVPDYCRKPDAEVALERRAALAGARA